MHRLRNNGQTKSALINFVDRERHPVDGNGAFGDDISEGFGRHRDVKLIGVFTLLDLFDCSNRIYVPLHDMPFETIAQLHRRFDVHRALKLLGWHDTPCLVGDFDAKAVVVERNDSETNTVDSDRVTDLGTVVAFEA